MMVTFFSYPISFRRTIRQNDCCAAKDSLVEVVKRPPVPVSVQISNAASLAASFYYITINYHIFSGDGTVTPTQAPFHRFKSLGSSI